MKYLKDDDSGYTTVKELIDILSGVEDQKNTLVVIEGNNNFHDIIAITKKKTINYRKCICLLSNSAGVNRPGDMLSLDA